jgi:hypothetical protein
MIAFSIGKAPVCLNLNLPRPPNAERASPTHGRPGL